jgi:alpha-L-rhamnosidase
MQYAGDTMITSKLGMLTTGDYQLSRQALYHFDWSRLSDGLTHARYPSRLLQVIPAWSIHWITNVRDYYLCTADSATLRDMLPGMRAVLDWYRRHGDEDGLPAKMPYWNITDWCPWWPRGVVPGADTGPTCIHAAQYINALDEVAWMTRRLGNETEAGVLETEATNLRRHAQARFWSEKEGLYFDRPGGPEISQYGNAWAIVAGIAGPRETDIMLKRFPHDEKLAPGSFFWWHTGFNALAKTGRYDDMPSYLGPWHESVGYGLSTFVEENSYWRSLCHAWSAHPVLEFQQRLLGVTAVEPGYAKVNIEPRLCGLTHAAGSVCTPRGMIEVSWRIDGGKFHFEAKVPPGTATTITAPGGSTRSFDGGNFKQTFDLS